ncbi:FtsX-like permease family protein [Ginsengibacter hankyongi]|uniref:FtsX-like permease family protein n=1 Tax=Ginsengibacter hankyongi TaxID=2607284 RepID=A0A5J5IN12_9BACT|nr:ABC transporter permease [Ginsengibacter hankyongi]KAA9040902.1 FtsX-like permease family protein [Ginsengibacter hankyongi]
MIKNLLLVAFRNFKKDKWYTLLNVLGLTIGITFSLFLIFYIRDELNYDRYLEKSDRIYRIVSYIQERDKNTNWTLTQLPVAATVKKDFPEVEDATWFISRERTLFKNGENSFYETKVYYADSTVFNIFTYKFLEGDVAHALNEPNSIVISKSLAEKYFGKNTAAVGKTLKTVYDLYKVTGVIEDVPKNSHLRFDMLISGSTLLKGRQNDGLNNWGNFNNFTYVLLKPGTNVEAFNKKLVSMYKKYVEPLFAQFNIKMQYGVQPITAIHLHSNLEREPEELGNMSYIWIFSAVAFFMLLIACINYMNLTTARSARRAKEIGIRKVTGSTKKQLVLQFLMESLLTALMAVLLSMLLVILLLSVFNSISGKAFTIHTLLQPFNIILLAVIVLFTGLVGGSYPAFYLSGFQPVSILKGALSNASGNVNLRRTLVVLQFSISMIMLICTWVVYSQLSYLRKKDLGFNKDQVMTVTVNTGEDERSKIYAMNNEFRSLPGVKIVGTGNSYPGSANSNLNLFTVETKNGHVDKAIECYSIDENYLGALGIPLEKGRNFSIPSDTLHSIIVNEAMVKHFGWDNAIGKRVKFPGDTSGNYLEVVGVIKDFHQKSLYNPIAPLLLFYGPNSNIIQLKISPANIKATIAQVESSWKKYFPQLPFEYKFLDEDFNSQYAADQKRGMIFAAFSILTIIITCLGLLGLTAFTTQQKQKEISIRRVLGASIAQVVTMTTKNYLWLALIAALIAFPVAYYFMYKWLQIFPYNTGLSVIPFILSAFVIVITASATAMFYSAKAAVTNPAKILKTE